MQARKLLLAAATLALLFQGMALAPASAQEDPGEETSAPEGTDIVTFYGHVFGHGLDAEGSFSGPMPANTEAPIGEDNYGIGTGADCGLGVFGDCTSPEEDWNKLALFSTAGFVDVNDRNEFDTNGRYALLHNERGQTQDILLDTSQAIQASIFISLDSHGWPVGVDPYGSNCIYPHPPDVPCVYPYWGWDPGVYRDVVVDATLYKARLGEYGANASDAPPIHQALLDGEVDVVAKGQWGPGEVVNGLPGAPNVNEFEIDLGTPQVDTIPKEEDFFIVYQIYQETAGQQYFLDGDARWWSGEFFPPTFTMPTKNAFTVERVLPQFAHGKMALLGVMNTPWGSYDIDPESVELTMEGPNGAVEPTEISRFGSFSVAHGGHYLPINITWIWDYQREQQLTPGEYTVTVSANNFQDSASAACTATFTITRGPQDSLDPGPVEAGLCGEQTISQERLEEIQRGAAEESGDEP